MKHAVWITCILLGICLFPETSMAGIACHTYRVTFPHGSTICGVYCPSDNTNYVMDCGADIFEGGYEWELSRLILGTGGADHVSGVPGNDAILGLAANDILNGSGGDDWLEGNDGADTLVGGAGHDLLLGGAGNDHYFYQPGDGDDVILDDLGENLLTLPAALAAHTTSIPDGEDLVLFIDASGASGSIRIEGYYTGAIFTIEFAGGPVIGP